MYKILLKPILFLFNPEAAHKITLSIFNILLKIPFLGTIIRHHYKVSHSSLQRNLFGLTFQNPIGLAAGFDKDGKAYNTMQALGFGFIEIGTVTPIPQVGNEKPRLFRLPQDQALINRMGFNNAGMEALAKRLGNRKKSKLIVGGNIGKNKITPNDQAYNDYLKCFETLYDYVDYFVVNVSSPNTPNLRNLQQREPLTFILNKLKEANHSKAKTKPILLKIAPDLTFEQLDDIIDIVISTRIDGIIASNTTISRSDLQTNKSMLEKIGNGGLSGKPLKNRNTKIIKYIHTKSQGKIPIIAVGGIDSPEAAQEKLNAGASLIQVYTGLIYQGPQLIRKINKSLIK